MFGERILIEKVTQEMMKFLSNFDKNRTIGSITKKEVKSIMQANIKEQLEKLKKLGL